MHLGLLKKTTVEACWFHKLQICSLKDTKTEDISWVDRMKLFLDSNDCPNFVKADVERAKQKANETSADNDNENDKESVMDDQPEWMELIHPCKEFDECQNNFIYNDGVLILIGVKLHSNIPQIKVLRGFRRLRNQVWLQMIHN